MGMEVFLQKESKFCEFVRPLQNTKPLWAPKYTPKYTPESSPKTKIRKNTKNTQKSGVFVLFSYFFCILVSGEDSGYILGCILSLRGVLYFVGGAGTRKASFPGTHKIGTAISGPRIAGKRFLRARGFFWLLAPYRTTLRCHRCNTHAILSRDTFSGRLALPQNGCDTPLGT